MRFSSELLLKQNKNLTFWIIRPLVFIPNIRWIYKNRKIRRNEMINLRKKGSRFLLSPSCLNWFYPKWAIMGLNWYALLVIQPTQSPSAHTHRSAHLDSTWGLVSSLGAHWHETEKCWNQTNNLQRTSHWATVSRVWTFSLSVFPLAPLEEFSRPSVGIPNCSRRQIGLKRQKN